jgi:Zn-finger nucleic acid-binding protein
MNAPNEMKCPVCDVPLVMTERQNIEVDYCPKCRGVWLDRGELDKIIERSAGQAAAQPAPSPSPAPPPGYGAPRYETPRYEERPYRDPYGGHQGYHGKRRKSWLEEIFD